MRELYWRVYGIGLGDNKIVLYEDKNEKTAEKFAEKFDGGTPEVFIERVWKSPGNMSYHDRYGANSRPGSEL